MQTKDLKVSSTKFNLGEIMANQVNMNLKVNEYTSRVLGVIKEKYGLKDKAQALDKFTQMYGEEYADREIKDEIVREVIESCDRHIKKYGFRTRTVDDLRKLIKKE